MRELSKEQINSDNQDSKNTENNKKDTVKRFEINEEKLVFFKEL